jgi:pimeloyl-ACP methyl ester carboxylesterase
MRVAWLFSVIFWHGILASTATAESIARLRPQHSNCETPCKRTAVIFIHGITGSKRTWGEPGSNLYWPTMLSKEPNLADDLDIYQIEYNSWRFSGPAAQAIESSLEDQLDAVMKEKRYSKVIFIAHSLGGILAHAYLLNVKLHYGHRALSRFRLLITLGTPNQGSSLANIARLATANEQIRVLRTIDVNDFLQLLNHGYYNTGLKHEGCFTLKTFAAFERNPTPGLGIVVSEASATAYADGSMGFYRNHLQLPTPSSITPPDPVYAWATDLVAACVHDDEDVCPAAPLSHRECPTGDFPE